MEERDTDTDASSTGPRTHREHWTESYGHVGGRRRHTVAARTTPAGLDVLYYRTTTVSQRDAPTSETDLEATVDDLPEWVVHELRDALGAAIPTTDTREGRHA